MSPRALPVLLLTFALACVAARHAEAQYSTLATPFNTVNHSFFERIGMGFGFNIRGAGSLPGDDSGSGVVGLSPFGQMTPTGDIQFRQGGFGAALPPFGGFNAAADARLGFGASGNAGDLFINGVAQQGSNASIVSQSASVVVPNGGTGTIIDATQRPFVTGLVPVVGAFGPGWSGTNATTSVSPLRERLARLQAGETPASAPPTASSRTVRRDAPTAPSSAERGDLSVREIRRQQQQSNLQQREEVQQWLERARQAEASGKPKVAKIYYRIASNSAEGELKQQLLAKIKMLDESSAHDSASAAGDP